MKQFYTIEVIIRRIRNFNYFVSIVQASRFVFFSEIQEF